MSNERSFQRKQRRHANDQPVQAARDGDKDDRINLRISSSLKKRFKRLCQKESRDMSTVLTTWIRNAVRNTDTGL